MPGVTPFDSLNWYTKAMLTFTAPQFVLMLAAVLFCWHFILPKKLKKPALLLFSYYYAWKLGGTWTVIVLGAVTILTYFWAFILAKSENKKGLTIIYVILLLLLLIYSKQSSALSGILSKVFHDDRISIPVVAMIGLSYYSFSAMSYIIDIYRGKDQADRNFLDVALWLGFFAKIIAGPIERHNNFKTHLDDLSTTRFDMDRIKRGLLICARGYFYKMIIADRLVIFVDAVFSDLSGNHGFTLFLAMMLFTVQVYFDFAGYSLIALGIARALDLNIAPNFYLPFFSESIKEVWGRWHMSLSFWFRDYVYISLGGSKKGKFRKNLNLIITFLASGIWHGTGFSFILWGFIQAILQIIEGPFRKRFKFPKLVNILITDVVFISSSVLNKLESFQNIKIFLKRMFTSWNPQIFTDGTLTGFGLDRKDWFIMLAAMGIVLIIETLQYKGISLYQKLQSNPVVVRWAAYYLIIIILLVFGMYGSSYDPADFFYLQF